MALLSEGYGDDDIKEMRLNLAEAAANPEPSQLRSALAHILAQMTQGNSLSALFPELVKICATPDLPSKKLVYLYMDQRACQKPSLALLKICATPDLPSKKLVYLYMAQCACQQPSLALLAINCLLKDCQDANPMVRGLALRTLCSLRLPLLLEYVEPPLLSGLRDKSAYVRRIAVLGCLRAYKLNPTFIKDRNIIDQLCELVADRDGLVMINVLCVLHELQDGLLVTQHVAYQLLNRLTSLSEWGQIKALQFLLLYEPKTEEEVLDMMNLVDGCVRHPNSGVSLGAVHLMLHISRDLPNVNLDVMRRLKGVLLSHLSSDQPAFVYASLCHLQWLFSQMPQGLTKYYKKFYCKYNEPTYLRCKRIDLLVQLAAESNIADIVAELSVYAIDVSTKFGQHAVRALATISQQNASFVSPSMDALVALLQLGIDHVSSAVFAEMQDLLSLEGRYQEYVDRVLDLVPGYWSNIEDEEGRCALIWLVGHHGQKLSDAPYLIESAIDNIMEESSSRVKGHLITATTKLFFSHPAECQDTLATLLQHCIETETDVHLKEKALSYYKMLNADVMKAKAVICSSQCLRTPSRKVYDNQRFMANTFNSFRMLMDQGQTKELTEGQTLQVRESSVSTRDSSSQSLLIPGEGTLVYLGLEGAEESKVKGREPGDLMSTSKISTAETLSDLHINPHRDINDEHRSESTDKNAVDVQSHLRNAEILDKSLLHNDDAEIVSSNNSSCAEENGQKQKTKKQAPISISGLVKKDGDESGTPVPSKTNADDASLSADAIAMATGDSVGGDVVGGAVCQQEGAKHHGKASPEMSRDGGSGQTFDRRFAMSPQEFEENWMAWTNSEMFEVATEHGKAPSRLLKELNGLGLQTMASTPDGAPNWRAFLYAKTMNGEIFLLELTTGESEGISSVCIKYSDATCSSTLLSQVVSLCKAALS